MTYSHIMKNNYNLPVCITCMYGQYAGMMELADVTDSKSVVFGRVGSSPTTSTVTVVQLVRTPGCDPGGRRFESAQSPRRKR